MSVEAVLGNQSSVLIELRTCLDTTALKAAQLRRLAWSSPSHEALSRLARLRRNVMTGLAETRVEQSFNEQIFAHIFGYQTLLSGNAVPFHLQPKSFISGRRYDDFSLGFFGTGDDRILASGELKGVGADLDRPQTGYEDRKSPVEQALDTGRQAPACRWVLVSNFIELRLYSLAPEAELARANLLAVRSRRELATLRALFDRNALLGSRCGEPEMTLMTSRDSIASPLEPQTDHLRVVLHFVPDHPLDLQLNRMEQSLRDGMLDASSAPRVLDAQKPLRINAADGWVAGKARHAEGRVDTVIAASTDGQVQTCVRFPVVHGNDSAFNLRELALYIRFHVEVVGALLRKCGISQTAGTYAAELRDVKDRCFTADPSIVLPRAPAQGEAGREHVLSSDFPQPSTVDSATLGAAILAEFAIQFRQETGGVALDEHKLTELIRADRQPIGRQ